MVLSTPPTIGISQDLSAFILHINVSPRPRGNTVKKSKERDPKTKAGGKINLNYKSKKKHKTEKTETKQKD